MSYLRRLSTPKLLAALAVLVVLAAVGAAIARAALTGGTATPPRRPLADALRDGLAAPKPAGITARIRFTNNLLTSSTLGGAGSPMLTGASGRLWAANDGRFRLELQSDRGDVQVVDTGRQLRIYDDTTRSLYRIALPQDTSAAKGSGKDASHAVPSLARIQRALLGLATQATITGPRPGNVAGQPAYTVRISPRHDAGLIGAAELAWDARRGVPLRLAVYAAGSASPVLELAATDIHYGPVPTSSIDVPAPADAHVTDLALPRAGSTALDHRGRIEKVTIAQAAARVPFRPAAPATLVGLPRKSVHLIHGTDGNSVLLTYGRGLGALLVVERAAKPSSSSAPTRRSGEGALSLPKVNIAGATGTELATALGTVLQVEKGDVQFVLAGSLPAPAAQSAARELIAG